MTEEDPLISASEPDHATPSINNGDHDSNMSPTLLFEDDESLDLPEPDEFYDDLNLSFHGDSDHTLQEDVLNHDFSTKEGVGHCMDGYIPPKESTDMKEEDAFTEYILGSLIVRVVGAKDLRPVRKGGFVGGMLYNNSKSNRNSRDGGRRYSYEDSSSSYSSSSRNNHRPNSDHRRQSRRQIMDKGLANPYATIVFGSQTQNTPPVYDTVDPVWPRGKQSFFDVSLPIPRLAQDAGETKNSTTSFLPPLNNNNPEIGMEEKGKIPIPPPQKPILTIAISHSNTNEEDDDMKLAKKKSYSKSNPKKESQKINNDDTDNTFLGIAHLDVTSVVTGKDMYIDEWLQLGGGNEVTGYVRVICEYEPTDPPPRPGDIVRFTSFVNPLDIFPIPPSQTFRVDRVLNPDNNNNNHHNDHNDQNDYDNVILSYTTPENWQCTFQAHSFMLICAKRHQTAVELYQDEIIDFLEKVSHSPALHTITQTANKLPEEGLLSVGMDVAIGSLGLLGKWYNGGIGTAVEDIVYATNLDGQHSHQLLEDEEGISGVDEEGISVGDEEDEDEECNTSDGLSEMSYENDAHDANDTYNTNDDDLSIGGTVSSKGTNGNCDNDESIHKKKSSKSTVTPNGMPSCPISGQPMKHPVVAADGHTYEKASISRWLRKSNISPLTGMELAHKELVPNYLLLSTFQERK